MTTLVAHEFSVDVGDAGNTTALNVTVVKKGVRLLFDAPFRGIYGLPPCFGLSAISLSLPKMPSWQ
ncbi:MAG: hypothetical protein K8I27_11510 [Planctomycetes bacterium]|nr:hypothetical protein [Planctomycetota bacterium]